jgi:hypothetical protein
MDGTRAAGNYSAARIAYTSSHFEIRRTEMTNKIRTSAGFGKTNRSVKSVRARATALLGRMLLGVGIALAATHASSAQSYDPSVGTGNIVPFYGQTAPMLDSQSFGSSYARVVPRGARAAGKMRASTPLWNLYNDESAAGATDPDPNIRFQLNRESLQGRW